MVYPHSVIYNYSISTFMSLYVVLCYITSVISDLLAITRAQWIHALKYRYQRRVIYQYTIIAVRGSADNPLSWDFIVLTLGSKNKDYFVLDTINSYLDLFIF